MTENEQRSQRNVPHFAVDVSVVGSDDHERADSESPADEEHNDSTSRKGGAKQDRDSRPTGSKDAPPKSALRRFATNVYQSQLAWIPTKMNARALKPVVRSAVAAWLSLLMILITPVEDKIGFASFLVLIGVGVSPPNEPFVAIVRREINIMSAVCLSWAWACIGLAFADLARNPYPKPYSTNGIYDAEYVGQVAPNAILMVFLALGAAFWLTLKAKLGPGPYVFATVFGCISLDICITTGALFPYPYYIIGKAVALPMAVHSAISILCSAVIFPESLNAQFTKRLIAVLDPLGKALRTQPDLLHTSCVADEFDPAPFQKLVSQAEAGLLPLRAASDLLKQDISYGRFSGRDLKTLRDYARKLTVRCDGLAFYYRIVEPGQRKYSITPAVSQLTTPVISRTTSRADLPASISRRESHNDTPTITEGHPLPAQVRTSDRPILKAGAKSSSRDVNGREARAPHRRKTRSRSPTATAPDSPTSPRHSTSHTSHGHVFHLHHKLNRLRHNRLHISTPSLLQEALNHSIEQDVGVFESQRYMDIESRLYVPRGDDYVQESVKLLGEASTELLKACAAGVESVVGWLERNNTERFARLSALLRHLPIIPSSITTPESDARGDAEKGSPKGSATRDADELLTVAQAMDELKIVLDKFKTHDRLIQLRQYVGEDGKWLESYPPHRYLFQSFVYHFHLLELSESLVEFQGVILDLSKARTKARVWMPELPMRTVISRLFANETEYEGADADDEDPRTVGPLSYRRNNPDDDEGTEDKTLVMLTQARPRDPDAYPPSNRVELVGNWIYVAMDSFTRGNLQFALKGAFLTAIMSLPSFYASSAEWAYAHKWVWAIIMTQLTVARYKGETVLNFVNRIIATFCGGAVGMAAWYISTGSGRGNPYGLAATCAVLFPMLLFFRVHYPGPPMLTLVTTVTVMLIVGYSWQDTHISTPSSPGFGWDVAWRRFLLIVIGVTAAFISSFLPPTVTVRRSQRIGQATIIKGLGNIICSVISIASSQDKTRQPALIKDLIIIRSKIRKLKAQANSAAYEFSLRGKWPAERYQQISDIQLEVAYLLSHLYTVVIRMDNTWVQAFLARTRLLDPDFLGSLFSTITLCSSSLETGAPLPQITAAPLIDQFMKPSMGFNVVAHEYEFGLPHIVTPEVLANEQYMCFSVGVSSVNGLIRRVDRLTVAVKELVGETYHIDGVEIPLPMAQTPGGLHVH